MSEQQSLTFCDCGDHNCDTHHHHNHHDHNHPHHDHDHCEHDHDHHDHDHDHADHFEPEQEQSQDTQFIKFIFGSSDYKQAIIIAFLYIALAVQAFYSGLTSSSVHLTEESFDCILNSIVIVFAIYCGIKAKTFQPTKTYPFAMQRLEYLSSFTLCIHVSILTMFQISRNAHEILEDLHVINHPTDEQQQNQNNELYYASLRIALSFAGIFLFVEYIQPNFITDKEQLQQFVSNYKDLIGSNPSKYYYTHYLNMHAITMLFLCELLFNIGTFLECMLDNSLSYAAIGTIIAMTNTIIIIIQLSPLVQTSIQALLLATNEKFTGIRQLLQEFNSEVYIWNHGADHNAIILAEGSKKRETRQKIKEIVNNKFKNCFVNIA
ncbi:unnamed protein product (macronuclear) [Paramecium tetraurelia]|uniref:Cation efflux protein transmembrane domain-containing protein n=1 Tax=Paramecium tetraurelia TaxID=5888 RepID=A0E502_PARTE|nr:uncharacterized protein GSPATT00023546001 [Paramecium tetraurelia]CAK90369.1 unnamed protein product [Paramecium tetraurelia]|eukprot:XP_001457766.1 hypothetical protein (macronuclear) [Paramecium tetraurelia strain d4-2]